MVANSDNTDQIFLRELSVLGYLFAISSQPLNSVLDSECIRLLFVCFVALRPKSTAMVIAGRSVHLTTLFPGQA